MEYTKEQDSEREGKYNIHLTRDTTNTREIQQMKIKSEKMDTREENSETEEENSIEEEIKTLKRKLERTRERKREKATRIQKEKGKVNEIKIHSDKTEKEQNTERQEKTDTDESETEINNDTITQINKIIKNIHLEKERKRREEEEKIRRVRVNVERLRERSKEPKPSTSSEKEQDYIPLRKYEIEDEEEIDEIIEDINKITIKINKHQDRKSRRDLIKNFHKICKEVEDTIPDEEREKTLDEKIRKAIDNYQKQTEKLKLTIDNFEVEKGKNKTIYKINTIIIVKKMFNEEEENHPISIKYNIEKDKIKREVRKIKTNRKELEMREIETESKKENKSEIIILSSDTEEESEEGNSKGKENETLMNTPSEGGSGLILTIHININTQDRGGYCNRPTGHNRGYQPGHIEEK